MLCALIMAGGKGERFWPLSTDEKPKQFLKLLGEKTMIQMTVDRLKDTIPLERIFIVTGNQYKDKVMEQLPEIPERNIILEPIGKNTAPCIALSALYINQFYKEAILAVLPADHLIENNSEYADIILKASKYVESNNKAIVTIGITPNRPETGYGYIKVSDNDKEYILENKSEYLNVRSKEVLQVEKFVEKPSLEKAQQYLNDGSYLWNGGMFVWHVDNILELTKKYLNDTYNILMSLDMTSIEGFGKSCEDKYYQVEAVSVDYGIMEKAGQIYVIPGDFGWDDVGSWSAVERYSNKSIYNNVLKGEVTTFDSRDNLMISTNKPIVTAGVENLLVVESDDMILVCSKDYVPQLKDIKKKSMGI